MRRREMLAGTAVALLAGCLWNGGGSPSNGETSPPPGETTTATPQIDNTFLKLPNSGCGTVTEQADVSADEDELRVIVDGTTSAESQCYTARLADATYDADADELRMTVETYDSSEDDEACAQCITELDYVVTAEFSGALPGSVVVVHQTRGEEREVTSTSLGATSTNQTPTTTSG